eukprot:Platyproteum_vivax@DN4851_c0_g1_i1.p1
MIGADLPNSGFLTTSAPILPSWHTQSSDKMPLPSPSASTATASVIHAKKKGATRPVNTQSLSKNFNFQSSNQSLVGKTTTGSRKNSGENVRQFSANSTNLRRVLTNSESSSKASSRASSAQPIQKVPKRNVGDGLGPVLLNLGCATASLHSFKLSEALDYLHTLSASQQHSGVAYELLAHILFEMQMFSQADAAFVKCQEVSPGQIRGAEIWSSVLWQLQKRQELARLAEQLVKWDRFSPQSWCAMGNWYSLKKQHTVAIKLLLRCVDVDSSFVYAYTLAGHEYVACDRFEEALVMYHKAVELDSSHYNAWWGLGNVYYKQEAWPHAATMFSRALAINPSNSILTCYLGMVVHAQNNLQAAMSLYNKALELDSNNSMAAFRKAELSITLDGPGTAVSLLQECLLHTPNEACVHLELGKAHAALGQTTEAFRHFQTACSMTSSLQARQIIKSYMDHLPSTQNVAVSNEGDLSRKPSLNSSFVEEPRSADSKPNEAQLNGSIGAGTVGGMPAVIAAQLFCNNRAEANAWCSHSAAASVEYGADARRWSTPAPGQEGVR